MSAFDDARSLVQHAQDELPKIRQAYDESLAAKTIAPRLLVEIKNVCENLRSALDFVAHGLFDRHCTASAKKAKIYFPYATAKRSRAEFENSGRIEACMNTLFQFVRWEQDMKPTYFDLSVHDVAKAKAFFEHVLHWDFERFEMPYEYYRIKAGPESEIGIDGGIGAVKDAPTSQGAPMTQVTVPVSNLTDVLARVVAAGGSVVEQPMPIPGIGWYATCAEPGGLKFGLIQADATARL